MNDHVPLLRNVKTQSLPHRPKLGIRMRQHTTLEPLPLPNHKNELDILPSGISISDQEQTKPIEIIQCPKNLYDVVHPSYGHYLNICFANHYNAVINADLLWYTALLTLSTHVTKNPELYRNFLVKFQGERIAMSTEVEKLDLHLDKVFDDDGLKLSHDRLFPSFSTSSYESRMAMHAVFSELISPYYSGWITACGIPKLEVEGKVDDYTKLSDAASYLSNEIFRGDDVIVQFLDRLNSRAKQLGDFLEDKNDGHFLNDYYFNTNCSSGHAVYGIRGWFCELISITPRSEILLNDSCLKCSVASFRQVNQDTRLACVAGVFSSLYDKSSNTLIPQFGHYWVAYAPKC